MRSITFGFFTILLTSSAFGDSPALPGLIKCEKTIDLSDKETPDHFETQIVEFNTVDGIFSASSSRTIKENHFKEYYAQKLNLTHCKTRILDTLNSGELMNCMGTAKASIQLGQDNELMVDENFEDGDVTNFQMNSMLSLDREGNVQESRYFTLDMHFTDDNFGVHYEFSLDQCKIF